MIEQHEKLLKALKAAEQEAQSLAEEGANISSVQQRLKQCTAEIQGRVKFLKKERKAAKGENAPKPQQSQQPPEEAKK